MTSRHVLLLFNLCILSLTMMGKGIQPSHAAEVGALYPSQLMCPLIENAHNGNVDRQGSVVVLRPGQLVTCAIDVINTNGDTIHGNSADLLTKFSITASYKSSGEAVTILPEGTSTTYTAQNLAFFTFTPTTPGLIALNVTERESGRAIASGSMTLVIYARPLYLENVICRSQSMALRGTNLCTAVVQAENPNYPVYVEEGDITFSTNPTNVIQGKLIPSVARMQLELKSGIDAPVTGMEFELILVVNRAPENGIKSTVRRTIALTYPKLEPTEYSTLTCDLDGTCTVLTRDEVGPVGVDTTRLGVTFDPASSPLMRAQWAPGADDSQALLRYSCTQKNRVVRGMINVFIESTVSHIKGSPFHFRYGRPPTALHARVEGCLLNKQVEPGDARVCRIRVDPSVTADVTYVQVHADIGAITLPPTFYSDEYETGWRFEYTAPTVDQIANTTDVLVHVTIDGKEVINAPVQFTVSDRNPTVNEDELDYRRRVVVVVGTVTFSAIIGITLVLLLIKQTARESHRSSHSH